MGLVLRLFQLTLGFLLRLALIVLVLFVAHLALTRWWPEVQRTARLLDDEPLLEQRLERAKADLELSQRRAHALEKELERRSEAELTVLRNEVDGLEREIRVLEQRKRDAESELRKAGALADEYCDTINPFKLWFCRDMKERAQALEAELSKVLSGVDGEAKRAEQRLGTLRKMLDEVARDPEAKLRVLGQRAPEETKKLFDAIDGARSVREHQSSQVEELTKRLEVVRRAKASTLGWLVKQWQSVWFRLVGLALFVLAMPYAQRTLWYFALMPLVSRARPIELSKAGGEATLSSGEARRSLKVVLKPGEVLYTRPSYARPVEGAASSKLLYRYDAPFVSYAAGLVMLTRLEGRAQSATSATLSAPEDPNSYLMRIDLERHPGVVIRPKNLVGVLGDLDLETRYRPFSFHAWSTWQLRYILFAGTGSLIIEGTGDVVAERLEGSRAKIEQKLVLGFDSRLGYRTSRTETFLPYLFGDAPLVDDVFEKTGQYFWQKSVERPAKNPVERSFDAIFSALGKLLGF